MGHNFCLIYFRRGVVRGSVYSVSHTRLMAKTLIQETGDKRFKPSYLIYSQKDATSTRLVMGKGTIPPVQLEQ